MKRNESIHINSDSCIRLNLHVWLSVCLLSVLKQDIRLIEYLCCLNVYNRHHRRISLGENYLFLIQIPHPCYFLCKTAASAELAHSFVWYSFIVFHVFSPQTKVVSGRISPLSASVFFRQLRSENKRKNERGDEIRQAKKQVKSFCSLCLLLLVRKAFIPQILQVCIIHERSTAHVQTLSAPFTFSV